MRTMRSALQRPARPDKFSNRVVVISTPFSGLGTDGGSHPDGRVERKLARGFGTASPTRAVPVRASGARAGTANRVASFADRYTPRSRCSR
jgi:hypothetical protein